MSKTLELTYEQVERSKVYVSTNDTLKFKHPVDYIEPFMEELKPLGVDWSFIAEKGSENKNNEDDTETNIAYSRLITKAKLPAEYDVLVNDPLFKHLFGEIGFVYSLEGAKPEMRVYKGKRVSVCANLCIWGADSILQMIMTDGKSSVNNIYEKTKQFVDSAHKDLEKAKLFVDTYSNEVYGEQMINQKFGELFRLGASNSKFGITPVTGAIQAMLDKTSRYTIEENKTITAWKFYNAVTEQVKKSSILDEASRAIFLERMFPLPQN